MNKTRTQLDLCGTWDFYPVFGPGRITDPFGVCFEEKITVPSNFRGSGICYKNFKPYDLMEYPDSWNNASGAVYRRFFEIHPENGTAVFIHSENISQTASFYINGKHVCDWNEMYLPLDTDITEFLRDGENEIRIVCGVFDRVQIASGASKITDLGGSWFGEAARGIWGNIYLETRPAIHIDDVIIRTSVREKRLDVITSLSGACENAEIRIRVLDGDNTVMTLSGKEGKLSAEWDDPILWDTENPHLYTAVAELIKDGKTVDEISQRFGFREIWTEGTKFILNGTPINLRGDSWHFQGPIQMTKEYALNWYRLCRENGVNYIRLHAEPHPVCYLDAADEFGMLIVDETAIYGSGKSMDASNSKFIENCKKHVVRLVKRDRNHPSIIFWSLQNEMRWVDGRDVYKLYIPEMQSLMNKEDPTRKVSVDGDNRLISYENTQLESLHYNIDGTLAQWRREKPLTVGEHGGMWYVCPQNASAYYGLGAYDDFEPCATGFAMKERLFLEDARRNEVSGISTFNFAYYFTRSMPDEDVYLTDAPFKKIPKYSLTINNGYLKDYPIYRENPIMPFMREAFRPVTVINREYNRNFYGSKPLARSFDVYNDTLHPHECTVRYVFSVGGKTAVTSEKHFRQQPAEHYILNLGLPLGCINEKCEAKLDITLYHESEEKFSGSWNYNIYPESIKTEKVIRSRPVCFFGNEGFEKVAALADNIRKIKDISDADAGCILVLGAHLSCSFNDIAEKLERFVTGGGVTVILEQSVMTPGDLCLTNQDFFSAHTGNPEHPLLSGLRDEDMIFWEPYVTEDRPEPIIHRNYLKPQSGEYTFVLESAAGDYADGGDLWSPLMTAKHGKGSVILCQLEINENYEKVPQACILLRNILSFADNSSCGEYVKVGAIGKKAEEFLSGTNAVFEPCNENYSGFGILVADVTEAVTLKLKIFAENGGTVLLLPFDQTGAEKIRSITGKDITAQKNEVSHARSCVQSDVMNGVSPVDLFRYDKIPMSPRQVKNKRIAVNTVHADGMISLVCDVPNTIWEDSFWNSMRTEPCIIPIVSINRENMQAPEPLLGEIRLGKGRVILSQLSADGTNEKDIRVYTRILENLGAQTHTKLFSYRRTAANEAVDCFMTLPIEPWQDIGAAREYYTDPEFSLNNLGEGLYGWMLKVEKNRNDGFITVPDSAGKTYFLTCFADKEITEPAIVNIDSSVPVVFYLGGKVQPTNAVTLKAGVNRIVIEANNSSSENLRFRVIITDTEGRPLSDIHTHLTIDEVDPK